MIDLEMLSLENSFRTQVLVQFIFMTFPQTIIQSMNNDIVGWSGLAVFCFAITVIMFIQNLAYMTMYAIRRVIDNDPDAKMRPRTANPISKLQLDSFSYITAYLMQPEDDSD
jgi:hypothetical protein